MTEDDVTYEALWPLSSYILAVFFLFFIGLGAEAPEEDALDWATQDSNAAYTQEALRLRLSQIRGDQESPRTHETLVSVFFDQRYVTEILARIREDGLPPKFRYRDVLDLFADKADHDLLRELGELQDCQGWVEIDQLSTYSPVFDQGALSIFFTLPAGGKDESVIDLLPPHHWIPPNSVLPNDFSAYLNTFNQFVYEEETAFYRLNLEGAMRWAPWVLEGTSFLDPQGEEAVDWRNVRFVRDWPDLPTRLVIGETRSLTPRLLASDSIYGFRYSTNFDLAPYVITEPISEYSFLLERASNVEVWVNERHFQTLRLQAGPYDLTNFPLQMGSNNVELRITDDLGRQEILNFNAIKGPNLLAPGQEEYSFASGTRGSGKEFTGELIAGASYRKGINESLTLYGETRCDEHHQAFSLGSDFATSWLFGRADMAASSSSRGKGLATRLVLTRYFESMSCSYRFDYRQEAYAVQRQDDNTSRPKTLHEITAIIPSLGGYGSLRFSASGLTRWNGATERREEATWSYTLNNRWSFKAIGAHTSRDETEWSVLGQVSYHFQDENYRRHHDVQAGSDGYRTYSTFANNPTHSPLDWQLFHSRTQASKGDHTDNLRGSALYQHSCFHSYYTAEVGDFGESNNVRHSLNFNSSLSYVGGEVAVGQPIYDSFAQITAAGPLAGVDLLAFSGGQDFKSCGLWPIVAPNLFSYYPSIIRIDTEDDAVILEQEPFHLLPSYKSGYMLVVTNGEGEGGILSVSGRLYDHSGDLLSLKPVLVSNLALPDSEPFLSFTNEQGEFRVGGLNATGRYKVELATLGIRQHRRNKPVYEFALNETDSTVNEVAIGDLAPINPYVAPEPAKIAKMYSPPATKEPRVPGLTDQRQLTLRYSNTNQAVKAPYAVSCPPWKVKQKIPTQNPPSTPRALRVKPPFRYNAPPLATAPMEFHPAFYYKRLSADVD